MENNLNKQFIYGLKDPITKEILYVGKSSNPDNRLKRHMSDYSLIESWTEKNKWLLNLKNNGLSPEIEIIDEGTDDNINELEIRWISYYKLVNPKLKNGTEGGDGYNWTGKNLKEEHKKKIGYNHPFRKEVIQFDLDNNIINKFISSKEAEKITGLNRKSITKCCNNIKYHHTVGKLYYFRFIDNYFPCIKSNSEPNIDNINSFLNILKSQEKKFLTKKEEISIKLKEAIKKRKKAIIQYDLSGNIIKRYDSLTEATKGSGIHIYLISNCCKKKGSYTVGGGHFWRNGNNNPIDVATTFRYEGDLFDYVPYNKVTQINSKKVCKYDLDGNLVEVYDSLRNASSLTTASKSNIALCCRSKINKSGNFIVVKGFTWRYFDETKGLSISK